MCSSKSSEAIKTEAKKQEKKYDWTGAINLHQKALAEAFSSNDLALAGEILQRIGYCHYRAAMQCQTQKQFRASMQMSVEAYEKASAFCYRIKNPEGLAKINHSKAMASYANYWLATEVSEKREKLDECSKLQKEALKIYDKAGDKSNHGKLCNELLECLLERFDIEQHWSNRRGILAEGIAYGQEAISDFLYLADDCELALAYYLTSMHYFWAAHYGQLEKKRKLSEKSLTYSEKALELSEKLGEPYINAASNMATICTQFWINGNLELSLTRGEEALRQSLKTRDNLLVGQALIWLADITYWKHWTEENPDKKREMYENTLDYANQAASYLERISSSDFAGQIYWSYVESLASIAHEVEIDRMEKRVLLEKAIETGRRAARHTNKSGKPEAIAYMALALSKAFFFLSSMETKPKEKKTLLLEALESARRNVLTAKQAFPLWYWYRGATHNYQASIEAELARIETGNRRKRKLLAKAVLDMERCIKLCTEWTFAYPQERFFAPLGGYYDGLGKILNQLFQLTDERNTLQKIIEVYQGALETYGRADMPSRLAETHWKIAKTHDQLGEYPESAENFELASKNYRDVAEKIPQLKDFCLEYTSYMDAWAELEKSRHAHENENYALATKHYKECSEHLQMTKKWSYLAPYYSAWSLLERGEDLSKQDKPPEAVAVFNRTRNSFEESTKTLLKEVGELESSEEREEILKLSGIARLREKYCRGRVLMEEAKVLNSKGDRALSAEKYALAGKILEEIIPVLKEPKAKRELQFAASLCWAWEKMEDAEHRGDAALYKEAADLFAKAKEISSRRRGGLTAIGNSCFCKALELGIKFKTSSNIDFYAGAKLQLENAADYYQEAGFEKAAFWVKATKRLFDAYVYTGNAEAEVDPEKKARFYQVAAKCLRQSADLYGKAEYPSRQREILQSLERVENESQFALSLSEVLKAPSLMSGTTGISMPDSTEKPAGLNDFESVNIQARLSVPKNFILGQKIQIKLDLANVGKKHGLLVRVEGLIPQGAKANVEPPSYSLENDSLNMKGKRLEPLAVESVNIEAQLKDLKTISLTPRIVYVDELGNFRTHQVNSVRIYPVVRFESDKAQKIFEYLINAFTQDFKTQSMRIEESGWRSLPQIIRGTKVSKSSLYGAGGRLGSGFSELERKGLIDLTLLSRQRGRGGHILRARICYEKEMIRRYVKEKGVEIPAYNGN
jgi:hypothetical protein